MYGSSVQPSAPGAPAGPPQSALDAYMANYGARLQSMLSSEAGSGALGGNPVMYQEPTSSLGPDMYQGYRVGEGAPFARDTAPQNLPQPQGGPAQQSSPQAPPVGQPPVMGRPPADTGAQSALGPNASPAGRRAAFMNGGGDQQPSALAGRGGAPAPTQGGASQPTGQGTAAGAGGRSAQGDQQSYGFRDLWNDLSAKQRKQQTDELAVQLKAGRKTIDSAYQDMIGQLGVRPQAGLTRQDKGMLLMEFGLRLMQHSASPAQGGYGANFGAAVGAAGAETMQQAMGLRQQHEQRAYDYDRLKQQMAIARGRDLANLQSRSVLESGRDFRAMNREDALMERSAFQQSEANQRQQSALDERRQQGDANRAAADARARNRPNAPGRGTGGRGTAAQSNYQLYLDTFGKDANGTPLTGTALQSAKEQALAFASNPHAYRVSVPQATQLAQTAADKWMAANRDSFLGMKPDQLQAEHDRVFNETRQRLLRSGNAAPVSALVSALAPAGQQPQTFASSQDAQAAYQAGRVKAGDVVVVGGKRFRVGGG
jgi:hypothetical protein